MTSTRRDFIKSAALLAAGGATLPASIQKALAIDPAPGTTYLDAEHVVILMQENRSFDHCYGRLRGVRGFSDPRAVQLPSGNPVWLQSNQMGETFAPFRLDIKDTKATWMSALPHSWNDQVDARADGRHDGWLDSKPSGNKDFAAMPLTLGYYDRRDIPFYYALADAFTVCDQNFCSSLTGTTPNRLYLWTGTVRERPSIEAKANVRNSDVDYDSEASWKTFPERLEENGISWRVYQNEISLSTGFTGEEDDWLANFTDNPLEWFTQYRVRFSPAHRKFLESRERGLSAEVARLEAIDNRSEAQGRELAKKKAELQSVRGELKTWSAENYARLSQREKNLHEKAFTTNTGDPDYRELTRLKYSDDGVDREMSVPKGDVLHQFREDVQKGKLPTVSWIVAPSRFSDHPGSPWYGAWYLSETIDILTQNPEVWKKTIFILCYDENDGYFDHVPPFVPPAPHRPETGKTSKGIDTSVEYVTREQEGPTGRIGPIGLGFRVPLVIASPWSRGGYVCSQVFDHTSIVQLLEKLVTHKAGKPIQETNISAWRRTVCGDLTSVFRPYQGEKIPLPTPVEREEHLGSIHSAQFKQLPSGFHKFTESELALARENPLNAPGVPRQERGTRPSCGLPYELSVDGALGEGGKKLILRFAAGRQLFGERSAGAPFHVYAPGKVKSASGDKWENCRTWSYAVSPGDEISDEWSVQDFEGGKFHLRVHGPNGFFREFKFEANGPELQATLLNGKDAALRFTRRGHGGPLTLEIEDVSYGTRSQTVKLAGSGDGTASASVALDLGKTHGWYDLRIRVREYPGFEQRYAGRVETGRESISDPLLDRA